MKKFLMAFKEAKLNEYTLVYNRKYEIYLQISHVQHINNNEDLIIIF
jgi:hypothetical protein